MGAGDAREVSALVSGWRERVRSWPVFSSASVRRVAKGSGWLTGAGGAVLGLSILQGMFAARALGAAGYGLAGLVTVVVGVVRKVFSFRMQELAVKYVGGAFAVDDTEGAAVGAKAAMLLEAATSAVVVLVVVAGSRILAVSFLKDGGLAPLIVFYGVTIGVLCGVSETTTGILQSCRRFAAMAKISVVAQAVGVAGMGVVLFTTRSVFAALCVYAANAVLGAGATAVIAFVELRRRCGRGWLLTPWSRFPGDWREAARTALSINVGGTLGNVVKDADLLLVGYFATPAAAGFYKLGQALARASALPVMPLANAAYPEVTELVRRRRWPEVSEVLRRGTHLIVPWFVLVDTGLLLLAPWAIRLVYGTHFAPAYYAMAILLVGVSVDGALFWTRGLLLSMDRSGFLVMVNGLSALAKVGLAAALIPSMGFVGAALISSGVMIAGNAWCVYVGRRSLSAALRHVPADEDG